MQGTIMTDIPTRALNAFVEMSDQPSEDRDTVLAAIADGNHTAREIADATSLNLSTVIREAEIMRGLYVTIVQGPPCVSYWLKGKEPKGRLVKQNGKLVELPPKEIDPELRDFLIQEGNERLAEAARPLSYDVTGHDRPAGDEYREFPIDELIVHPLNVRGQIDTSDKGFEDLVASIREVGVQEPLVVTPHDQSGKFRIVMGNRRRLAAAAAGLAAVPAILRYYDSPETELAVMLIENIQRENLKPMAEARAFRTLYLQSKKDINAVARQTGLTQSYIAMRLRLNRLEEPLQQMIDRRELSVQAGALISTLDPTQQKIIAPRVSKMKYQEVKTLVERIKQPDLPPSPEPPKLKIANKYRETTDEERFTRTQAIRDLKGAGDAWFGIKLFREAFDDVCIDGCLEQRDETLCHSCPMPRFVASVLRRKGKSDAKQDR